MNLRNKTLLDTSGSVVAVARGGGRTPQKAARLTSDNRGRGRGKRTTSPDAALTRISDTTIAPGRGRGRGAGDRGASGSGISGRGARGREARGRGIISSSIDTYSQATSNNLPVISYINVAEYFQKLRVPEQRQSKDYRSSRSEYGDNAIGYVKIRRADSTCIVEARVTPETSVNNTPYFVTVTINEVSRDVASASCNCQASMVSCKHQTALIFWLLRRAEEPSPTEVACYWKKAVLSTVKNLKSKTVDELLIEANDDLLTQFIEIGKITNSEAGVIRYSAHGDKATLYMDHLVILFLQKFNEGTLTCDRFLDFCREQMTAEMCKMINLQTKEQSAKSQWYYVRFARVTASKIFEVSRCSTSDGSLVSSLMGSRGFKGNAAALRGQKLELQIFDQLKEIKYPTIEKSGIILRGDMPIFGASPDGITSDSIFEFKCPTKTKSISNYIIQMGMSDRNRGILIVADPDYEWNRLLTEIEVQFDKTKLDAVVAKCETFWKNVIFPLLK